MTTRFIINHLWQSSCFALLAGLLAFVLRKNSPKVRYWVWLSASLKFLIPFALLVSLGNVVPRPARHPVPVAAPVFRNTLVQIAEPFSPAPIATVPARAALPWAPVAIGVVWAAGFLAITRARYRSWLGFRAALRAGTPIELPIPLRALITPCAEEPGVVGFLRPVLVLPAQLLEHLNPRQLGAILAHEMCHVRRRDNLFAAVHMVVEAIFWFHPLVWWIGSRMVQERELACDEEVLRTGCEPADYVGGILKVCEFYKTSALPCVSGVTGADVKKRLRAILAGSITDELRAGKKAALAVMALAALAIPILVGVIDAPPIHAQAQVPAATPKWEAVSIKHCEGHGRSGPGLPRSPDRVRTDCQVPIQLVEAAYGSLANGRSPNMNHIPVEGAPAWLKSEGYSIEAKAQSPQRQATLLGPMMQTILEDRFKLKIRRETRQVPVYELTVDKGGPKNLKPSTPDSCIPFDMDRMAPPTAVFPICGGIWRMTTRGVMPWNFGALGVTMTTLAEGLSSELDRNVIDKTGINGKFDIDVPLDLAPPTPRRPLTSYGNDDFVFAAMRQLGLKLEPAKGPGEFIVIDHVERPTDN